MVDITIQFNQTGGSGQELNPVVTVTNTENHDFKIVQQYTTTIILTFPLNIINNVSTQFRSWSGVGDSVVQERFLEMFPSASDMFNYY